LYQPLLSSKMSQLSLRLRGGLVEQDHKAATTSNAASAMR